jgi:IS605 OrfB family transposase
MEKNNTVIITRKIELKPVYDYDFETATEDEIKRVKNKVWERIRSIDNWGYRIANRTVSECWALWSQYQGQSKKDIPKIEPYKIFSEKLCVEFPEVKDLKISNIATGITKEIKEKIWTELYDYFNGKKSLPNYKTGYPLYVARNKNLDAESKGIFKGLGKLLDYKNKEYNLNIPLGKFKLYFGRDRSNNNSIIEGCRSGVYELCDSKVMLKGTKIFLLAVIRIPKEENKLDYNKYVGVDLGIAKPIVASVYEDLKTNVDNKIYVKKYINIGSIDAFLKERTRFQQQRRSLNSLLKFTKGSHGRKRKLLTLERFTKKEKNWVRTKNHQYVKELIEFVINNNVGNIVLEDLKGFNDEVKNKKFIGRNWSYFELQTMIENKAKRYNIEVHKIDPRNTSKACSQCDNIDSENRRTQSEFQCTSCGLKINADLNASRNISKKYINNLVVK